MKSKNKDNIGETFNFLFLRPLLNCALNPDGNSCAGEVSIDLLLLSSQRFMVVYVCEGILLLFYCLFLCLFVSSRRCRLEATILSSSKICEHLSSFFCSRAILQGLLYFSSTDKNKNFDFILLN